MQVLRKPYRNRQTYSTGLSIWGRDWQKVEQLGGDGREEEVAEKDEGRGGRTHSGFGGNFLFKSRFVLICLVLWRSGDLRGWAGDVGRGGGR